MKICLISNLYPPYQRGGAEQVVKNTVEGLLEKGHQVVVITSHPCGSGSIPNNHKHLRIYRFFPFNLFFYGNDYKYPSVIRFFWHIFDVFNIHSYLRVRHILQKENPDIVHTHNLKGLGYLIPAAIRHERKKHVHTLHDVQLVTPSSIIIKGRENNWPFNFFLRRWYEKITKFLFSSPHVVISPSKFLLEFYEHRGFFSLSRKLVVPNPVLFKPNLVATKKSGELFTFLYLGQIEEHKGVLFLTETFKKFLKIFPQTNLLIVGSGSQLEKIKKLALGVPQIVVKGRVSRDSLPQIFSQANLTVVPSLCYENSPTVIFESFSFGVPVLASSIEGVAELIKDKENGLTFLAGEEKTLIDKMTWAVQNPQQIQAMRSASLSSIQGRGLNEYLDKLLKMCYNI